MKINILLFINFFLIQNLSTCWGKVFYEYDEEYFYLASSTPILAPFEQALLFIANAPQQAIQPPPLEPIDQNQPPVPNGALNSIEEDEAEEKPSIFVRFLESREPSVMFMKKFLASCMILAILVCYFAPILNVDPKDSLMRAS